MNKLVLSIGLLFCVAQIHAQTTVNNELKNIIQSSFGYFPSIKESVNAEKTAQEKLKLIEMNRMPDFNVNGIYNYIMPKISFPINGNEVQFAPVNNLNASLNTSYTIVDFGRLKAAIEKLKSEIQTTKHSTAASQMQLAQQVASVYYSIIYFKKAVSVEDSVINYLKENKKMIDQKINNGDALKIDALNLQSSIDAEENKKIDLMSLLQKQINLLEYTCGMKSVTGNTFDFNVRGGDRLSADSAQYQNNPDFALFSDKTIQAQKELTVIKAASRPSVSLHASSGFKNGYVPDVNDIRFNYFGGLTLMMPLDFFGKTKQQIKVQQSIIKQSELATQSFEEKNKKEIKDILSDMQFNNSKIKNIENQIATAKKAKEITASRYENGIATYLEVEAAATNVERSELSKLQCEYQQTLNHITLSKLMGIEFWK